jgi:hypothetical protein
MLSFVSHLFYAVKEEMAMRLSDSVLQFVKENYARPARAKAQLVIEVRAGDVHSGLQWSRRVPLVCAALNSKKLQKASGLELIERSGPPSGQSTTMVYRYRVLPTLNDEHGSGNSSPMAPRGGLLDLYGICAGMYTAPGGAEAFIRSQHENFGSIVPDVPDGEEEKRQ